MSLRRHIFINQNISLTRKNSGSFFSHSDANMLIEAVPFVTVGKLQPFLLSMNSSALLLADFHCHLTMHEVCGYLGGTWDINSNSK